MFKNGLHTFFAILLKPQKQGFFEYLSEFEMFLDLVARACEYYVHDGNLCLLISC
jgi:hypothetical protein